VRLDPEQAGNDRQSLASALRDLRRAAGLSGERLARRCHLARVANTEYQDIRASVRRGLHHRQRELAALEADARQMRHFLPALITGLLQAPEYMRAAMDTPVEPAAGDTTTAIALKLERQAILHDKSKHFEFLLTESALRWQLCEPSVMAVQLDRLVSLSRLPNIRIGVLPFGIRPRPGGEKPGHSDVRPGQEPAVDGAAAPER